VIGLVRFTVDIIAKRGCLFYTYSLVDDTVSSSVYNDEQYDDT
jgi:hypothetical protein